MRKVECPSCKASYDVDERRIPASGMRMRCPKCSASFVVRTDGSTSLGDAQAAPKVAAPPPPAGGRPKLAPPVPMDSVVDLPAVSPPKPSFDLELDLPAPKAAKPALPDLDLPAPKRPVADFGELDLPAPKRPVADFGEVDLPAPKAAKPALPDFDLPAPKRPAADFGELDLPAPKAAKPALPDFDLPAPKAAKPALPDFDLPAPKAAKPALPDFDLPAPKAAKPVLPDFDLPAPKATGPASLDLDLPRAKSPGTPSLDLDLPRAKSPGTPSLDLDLPRAKSPGAPSLDLDLPRAKPPSDLPGLDFPSAKAPDLDRPKPPAAASLDLDRPRPPAAPALFGELDLGPPPGLPSMPPGLGDELELPRPRERPLVSAKGGSAFGELDLGVGGENDALEFGGLSGVSDEGLPDIDDVAPIARDSQIPDALSIEERKALAAQERKRKLVRVLGGTAAAMVAIGLVGFALKFTKWGPFGQYAIEQLLPAAGSAQSATRVATNAEARAKSDTFDDARASLRMLANARRQEGLNRALLSRSLLHESLYLVRFGDDTSAASRATGIAARLRERSDEAPGIDLALAAFALSSGDANGAKSRVDRAAAATPNDPYVSLVAGEVELASGRPGSALAKFRAALAHGGGARAQWGIARALLASNAPEANAAVDATLALSPRHLEARTAIATRHLRARELDDAVRVARQAGGLDPVDGPPLRGSRRSRAMALTVLGRAEELRMHRSDARFAYNAAADLDANNLDALVGAGRVLLEESMAREALVRFTSAIDSESAAVSMFATGENPRSLVSEARLGAIRALLLLERAQEASEHAAALRSALPNDSEVAMVTGDVQHALGANDQAEASYRRAIELAPSSFAAYLALSQLFFELERPDDAVAALASAEGKVQVTAEVRRLEGEAELRRNQLANARAKFVAALELDPQDRGSLYGLGLTYRREGAFTEAAAVFDRLSAIDAAYPGLALERGQIYEAQGQAERAVEMYERALRERPDDVDLQVRLGGAQVAAGRLDDAKRTLDAVLARQPNQATAIHYLGRLALERGNVDEAIARLGDALRLETSRADFHAFLALAMLEKNDLGGAQTEIDRTLAIDPQSVDGHVLRARLLARSGRVVDALAEASIALGIDPHRTEVWAVVGDCQAQLSHRDEAIEAYRAALAGDATRGDWWSRLARLQVEKGALADAIASYRRAVDLGMAHTPRPGYTAEALRGLGDTALERGDSATARDAYRQYLEVAPQGAAGRAEVQEALSRL